MESKSYIIDLQDYRKPESVVFTTRPRGADVRINSQIDLISEKFEKVIIKVPNDISSINPSFLEEFLENVVMKLGKAGFYEKFSFINEGRYKIDDDLDEAIERILRHNISLV